MAISNEQLEIWSHIGAEGQSKNTYHYLKRIIEDPLSSYKNCDVNVFLQGSYGNDTNIFSDSDVDIIARMGATYYFNIDNLSDASKFYFKSNVTPIVYDFPSYKGLLLSHLKSTLGSDVNEGNKAIFVKENGNRRNADIVASCEYRHYTRYTSEYDNEYVEGIIFWAKDGTEIINYPKLHSANCTAKHKATCGMFKRVVRVAKNLRNRMIKDGAISSEVAPSYFLEGLYYNVPSECYVSSVSQSFINSINWIDKSDFSKLLCANEMYFLLHPFSPVTWREHLLKEYLSSTINYWNNSNL